MATVPVKKLINGATIPVVGLGTYPLSDDGAARAVATALSAGYRLLDTAQAYGNERGVGQGIRDSGVPREEIFLTTKFSAEHHSRSGVRTTWENSVRLLGVDYLDLLLIHWPNPWLGTSVEVWEAMIELLHSGRVRAIGTSNFKPAHLAPLVATGVIPDVNQIQLSPYHQRIESIEYHDAHGIVTEGWSPLKPAEMLSDSHIVSLARRHQVSPAQIVLRWQVQNGFIPIPKSADPARQRQNLEVFGFKYSRSEMALLKGLDRGESGIADSDAFGH